MRSKGPDHADHRARRRRPQYPDLRVHDAGDRKAIGCTTYNDGSTALDGLAQNPPDLAILDIKMPRMDGMELLRKLRQSSDLPVIFLTSKDDEIDELFGLKMGADDFIKKPFSQRLLVERVRAVLRRRSRATEPRLAPARESRLLERGALTMDQERHTCTWNGAERHADGDGVPDPLRAGAAAGRREEPQRADGRGL